MATWPESNPTPVYPLIVTPRWQTNVSDIAGGKESRRATQEIVKIDVTVKYHGITATEAVTLYQFFMARRGAYESFWVYDCTPITIGPLYFATGNGITKVFDFCGKNTSDQVGFTDGIEDGSIVASMTYGTGADGCDQVAFTTPPARGAVMSATFTGIPKYKVRFAQNQMSMELFTTNLYRFQAIEFVAAR